MTRLEDLNLGLRFLLEVAALGALAYWGWTAHSGSIRTAWAIGLPAVAAALWATFRAPGHGGEPVVAVTGPIRLALELALFALAVGLVYLAGRPTIAASLGAALVIHYGLDRRRVFALLSG